MKTQLIWKVILALTIASMPLPAQASLVTFVSAAQAQGLTGNGASVTVWPGSGTNIDFTRTGETIVRAWLDDPSRLTIDFDGKLSSDGTSGSNSNTSGGANIVHLRQIVGVQFPNLPSTPTTLLTIVTQSSAGVKEYLFQVHYGTGTPQYAAVAVTPNMAGISADGGGIAIAGNRTASWDDVDRGLQQAIAQHWIASDSPVVARVQTFLSQVRNGTPLQSALTQANLSSALIARLATIGYGVGGGL